jgi:hypothetical protein
LDIGWDQLIDNIGLKIYLPNSFHRNIPIEKNFIEIRRDFVEKKEFNISGTAQLGVSVTQ